MTQIEDIQRRVDDYLAWFKDKTSLRQIDQWVEITTPYLDRHNDYIQIYAKPDEGALIPSIDGGYILTDDGHTISDLEQTGYQFDSPERKGLLKTILNWFGVDIQNKALEVRAFDDNFAVRSHNLIQAILVVNCMFLFSGEDQQ